MCVINKIQDEFIATFFVGFPKYLFLEFSHQNNVDVIYVTFLLFIAGFKHKGQNIDLNVVRLCFQVFLPDEHGKITRIVPPVVSQAIHDKSMYMKFIVTVLYS
jgi:hypothetical protein